MSLRPNGRADARKKNYKVGVDAEAARRKREDNLIEIRKNKREDSILKRRKEGMLSAQQPQTYLKKMLELLPSMVSGVYSNDPTLQLEASANLRKLLAVEPVPPIDEVVSTGVLSRFVEFLTRHELPQLQFEAAWCLTNITSGTSEHTKMVIDSGAIPHFLQLLNSPNDEVREQVVWALANVAGDSIRFRDLVLNHGALRPILAQMNDQASLSMLRNATWAVSNLCRGKPEPPFEQTQQTLPALKCLIYSNDDEILGDACWALAYLSDGSKDKIQAVIETGVCHRLVELLGHPSPGVLTSALRTVGNIVTGDNIQTQVMIDSGLLPCLFTLLTKSCRKRIKREACWTVSNITAGNKDQIQAVIDATIIPPLVQLITTAEFEIKKEAAWAMSNATLSGSSDHIKYLVNQGCIKPFCDLLDCNDPQVVAVCLDGLANILDKGESETLSINPYVQYIEHVVGLDKIQNLQFHNNTHIYEKVVKILQTYWMEEFEDEIIDPVDSESEQFFNFEVNEPQTPPNGFTFN